jgi:hypothetical protein
MAPSGAVFGTLSTTLQPARLAALTFLRLWRAKSWRASAVETVVQSQVPNYMLDKKRVESLSHDKLESQLSFLRLRDFSDGIDARREAFIPIVFRTPSLHVAQHSLAKVVFEESSKGLMSLGTVLKDHVPAIMAKKSLQ